MKWDWGLLLSHTLSHIADYLECVSQMLDADHDYRLDQRDFAMAVSQAIESLGGDDNNWVGGGEEDDKGGGK